MAKIPAANTTIYAIDSAEIEVRIAVSLSKDTKIEGGVGGSISAFTVNASYARTYGFKEEASSLIRIHLSAKPLLPAPAV